MVAVNDLLRNLAELAAILNRITSPVAFEEAPEVVDEFEQFPEVEGDTLI